MSSPAECEGNPVGAAQRRTNRWMRRLVRLYPFGKGRPALQRFALARIAGEEEADDVFGSRFRLRLDRHIDSRIFLRGAYEPENVRTLARLADTLGATVFLDVGANIGVYAIFFARQPRIRAVHAFEPNPETRAELERNLALNETTAAVRTHATALSDRTGAARLHLAARAATGDRGKRNPGADSLEYDAGLRHAGSVEVATAPLDESLPLRNERIAIKIDVEGHEEAVLRGMARTLRENRCVLQTEVFPGRLDAVRALLDRAGYAPAAPSRRHNHFFAGQDAQSSAPAPQPRP